MHRHRFWVAAAAALAAVAVTAPASAATPVKPGLTAKAAAALPTAGNGVFQIRMQNQPGLGFGTFTVTSGGRDVLYSGGGPGTSFMILRHNTADGPQDFVQGQYLTQPNEESLDDLAWTINPLGAIGLEAKWFLNGAILTEHVEVHGSTAADSSVEVTTTIDGTGSDQYQIQYLWDLAVGKDDGPVLQSEPAGGTFRPFAQSATTETTLTGFDSLFASDNDGNPATPTAAIGLTGSGPSRITPPPTVPLSAKFVCWPQAVGSPIGYYQTDPSVDISTSASTCTGPSGNDSAVAYLFAPGQSRVSASLFSIAPDATSLKVAPARLVSPALSATLTDTVYNHPVPGRTVSFSVNGNTLCTATTDANGVAACGGTTEGLAAALGYSGSYGGNAVWAATTGHS
ncbi:Ig-like domain-containing protein [Kutzneria sp. NPDC052558]|uniref:Ig-like domain-containing protein n=1 Tax=Kutzneria sp. NPDC052558 TaxID=3364121 RepID=UPI0037C8DBEE